MSRCFGLRPRSSKNTEELDEDVFSCPCPEVACDVADNSAQQKVYADWRDVDLARLTNQLLNLPEGELTSSSYYASVTFAICCRPSVVCLSVTLVRRSQAAEIFRYFSTPFGTLAIY